MPSSSINMSPNTAPIRLSFGSLVVPTTPLAGESLASFVVRTSNNNVLSWRTLLNSTGCGVGELSAMATRSDDLSQFAAVVGADANAMKAMQYQSVKRDGQPAAIVFFGAELRASLRTASRRIAPASMLFSAHHRALWEIQPLSFCAESWTMLTPECPNPKCGSRLDWSYRPRVGSCSTCEMAFVEHETAKVPMELRDDLGLLSGLIDPTPERRGAALAAVDPKLQGTNRGHLFELALACSIIIGFGASKGDPCDHSPTADLATLAAGAAMLRHWPSTIRNLVLSAQPGTPNAAIQSRFRNAVWSSSTPEVVKSLLHLACPELVTLTTSYPALVAQVRRSKERMTAGEFAYAAHIKRKDVSHLVHKGLLDGIDVGGHSRRHRWYEPEDAADIRRQLDDAAGIRRITSETGLNLPAIEQLVERRIFVRSNSAYVAALREGLHIETDGLSRFYDAMKSLPLATGEGWVCIRDAVKRIGVHEKPIRAIIAAGLKDEILLAYVPGAAKGKAAGLMVRDMQIQHWLDRWEIQMAKASDMAIAPWESPYLSHKEAMEHLQVHPREYEAGIRSQILSEHVSGVRSVCRGKLHHFGMCWISASEIGARLNIDPRNVFRLLAGEEIEKPSPARMWSRHDYLAIEGHLLDRVKGNRSEQLALPLAKPASTQPSSLRRQA